MQMRFAAVYQNRGGDILARRTESDPSAGSYYDLPNAPMDGITPSAAEWERLSVDEGLEIVSARTIGRLSIVGAQEREVIRFYEVGIQSPVPVLHGPDSSWKFVNLRTHRPNVRWHMVLGPYIEKLRWGLQNDELDLP